MLTLEKPPKAKVKKVYQVEYGLPITVTKAKIRAAVCEGNETKDKWLTHPELVHLEGGKNALDEFCAAFQ